MRVTTSIICPISSQTPDPRPQTQCFVLPSQGTRRQRPTHVPLWTCRLRWEIHEINLSLLKQIDLDVGMTSVDENTRVSARISCWRSPCPDLHSITTHGRTKCDIGGQSKDVNLSAGHWPPKSRDCHVFCAVWLSNVGVFVCLCVLCLSVSSVCQFVCQSVSFILSHFVSLLMFVLAEELKMYFPGLYSSNTFTRLVNIRGLVLSCSPTFTN